MDSSGQFYLFSICLLLGIGIGVLYDGLRLVTAGISLIFNGKSGFLKSFCEFFAFFCGAALFVFLSAWLSFPQIRLYMYLGIALGGLLYLKSWHRILDFLKKVCYNVFIIKYFLPFRNKIHLKRQQRKQIKREKLQAKRLLKMKKIREKRKRSLAKEVKRK